MNEDLIRFARLIDDMNVLSKKLDECRNSFYDGIHSFEEFYSTELKELSEYSVELKELIKKINVS